MEERTGIGIEDKEDNIWGLMLGTGYLKVAEVVNLAEGIYKVQILNYDVSYVLEKLWQQSQYKGNINNPNELR